MSLHFRALEVEEGDAFLLQYSNKCCLFDSGKSQKDIITLLDNHAIDKIDLAICSHNDIDHTNGFIGLLKSSKTIFEIWLPALWANILLFVFEHLNDIFIDVKSAPHSSDIDIFSKKLSELSSSDSQELPNLESLFDYEEGSFKLEIFNHLFYILSNKNIIDDTRKSLINIFNAHKGNIPPNLNKKKTDQLQKLANQLGNIMEIASLAYKKGCIIRWFEPTDYCIKKDIDYGFVALNSKEIAKVKRIKGIVQFMLALRLTVVNKYSLVFEYKKNETPVVRFSADSDSSCQSVYPYKNNIIITAPHHGARSNNRVYQNIKGDDIIWVRSGNTNGKLSDFYKKLNPKFCGSCHYKKITSEIHFIFDESEQRWIHMSGKFCNC